MNPDFDAGTLFAYVELVNRVLDCAAPDSVQVALGLDTLGSASELSILGEELWKARLETLDTAEAAEQLDNVGTALSKVLATATAAYRVNILDEAVPRKLIFVRSRGGQSAVLVFEKHGWFVVRIGESEIVSMIVTRAGLASRGFVAERVERDGVAEGLAWDGNAVTVRYDGDEWVSGDATSLSATEELAEFLVRM